MNSLRSYCKPLGAVIILWAAIAQPLNAATYYWDADATAAGNNSLNGEGLGGTGSWDLSSFNWWDGANSPDVLWPNIVGADTAVFSGSSGVVTLGSVMNASAIQFNTSGYEIRGPGSINLGGFGLGAVNLGGAGSATAAFISAKISGTNGLALTGSGTLYLSNAGNDFSGGIDIGTGATLFAVSSDAVLGLGNDILFDGGALGTSGTFTMNRSFTFNVAATVDVTSGTLTVTGALNGGSDLTKKGGGTLLIANDNGSFMGNIFINAGTVLAKGANGITPTALGSGSVILNQGILSLQNNNTGNSQPIATTYANNVIINGNSQIAVSNAGANSNNTIAIPSLFLNNSTLTVTNGNNYGFQVAGETTLFGAMSTINSAFNPPAGAQSNPTAGMVALSGRVMGQGALNKTGAGTVTLQNSSNDYSGGTNILAGTVQLNTQAAKLGTGNVIVNAGGTLAVVHADNVTFNPGQTLTLASVATNYAILRVDSINDVVTGSSLGSAYVSPYGAAFQINSGSLNYDNNGTPLAAANYTSLIDLAAIGSGALGNGKIFLGGTSTVTNSGTGGIVNSTVGQPIRLGAGGTLTLAGNNVLSPAGQVSSPIIIGSPISNVQTVANGNGIVDVKGVNDLTGAITINKGSTLRVSGTLAGSEGPLGSGAVSILSGTLDTTASNYVGASPQLANTTFNLFEGGALTLNNSATVVSTTDLRLSNTTTINLRSGTLSFFGSNTAAASTAQTVDTINVRGGNIINVTQGSGAGAAAIFTATNLNRPGQGAIAFTRLAAGTFGSATTQFYIGNLNGGGAPVPVNGMIAPWMVDGTVAATPTFLTYGGTGIAPAAFSANKLGVSGLTDIVNQDATAYSGTGTAYALRLTTGVMSGTVTINGNATDGAGLILSGAATHTGTFNFGAGGINEADIYVSADTTLSGVVRATNVTKFGPNTLTLTGANSNLTGPINIAGGTLKGSPIGLNQQDIILNGDPRNNAVATLDFSTTANGIFLNNVIIKDDGTITAGDVQQPRIQSITINTRDGGSTDPITLNIGQGLSVTGTTTLNGDVLWNSTRADRNSDLRARVLLAGQVTGAGSFNKWSGSTSQVGVTSFLNGTNNYSGGTTINSGALESLTWNGTPFGSGALTVNPGGILRIVNPTNVNSPSSVTINSDRSGLATISLAYSGAVGVNGGLTAPITFNNTNIDGPFSAVLAIDAVGYSGAINLNTFGGGTAFLGSTFSGNFSGSLTPSTVNNVVPDINGGAPLDYTVANPGAAVYRLGGGGSGFLQLTGAPNQLTGNVVVQIGAMSNVTQADSVQLVNGGSNNNATTGQGAVQILNVNNYSGLTILNGGATNGLSLTSPGDLSVANSGALGTSTIVFNGGALQAPTNVGLPFLTPVLKLSNPVAFTGDAVFLGATNLELSGPISLADNQTGVTRTISQNNTTGVITLSGIISDGAGTASGNSITKAGSGPLALTGNDTYTGYTNINGGTIVVRSDSSISPNSQISFNGGSLGAWSSSFTTDRSYLLFGSGTFDVGAAQTLTQSTLSTFSGGGQLQKQGLGTLVLNGVNSHANSNALWIFNGMVQVSSDANIGDTATNGTVVFLGGGLQIAANMSSNRKLWPNANTIVSGNVDVLPGVTFTSTGQISNNGTGVFNFIKTGQGTMINNFATNDVKTLTVAAGTFQTSSNQPFAVASTVNLNGGTLLLQKLTAGNQSVADITGTIQFGGGGHLNLEAIGTNSSEIKPANVSRFLAGTLVISNVANVLGQAGNGGVRVMPQTTILGTPVASVNTNGIISPSIITANSSGVANFGFYNTATTGITPYAGATVSSLAGLQSTAIGDISTVQNLTGTNRIYALRTTSDILGGTLVLPSVNMNTGGGILVNSSATISSDLVFDPTSTTTYALAAGATTVNTPTVTVTSTAGLLPGMAISGPNIPAGTFIASVTNATTLVLSANAAASATGQAFSANQGGQFSGEGLLYTAPGTITTLNGNVMAGSFTKFGSGTVVFGGTNNGILGSLTIQEGTLQVTPGARFARLQTDLVLNGNGVFDLNGNSERFSSIGNSNPIGGGLITNNGTSDATFSIVATAPTQSGPVSRQGTVGQNNQVINGLASTADLAVGMPVFGTNVAAGAVIRSIDSATQISISAPGNNANVGASIQNITFGSLYSGLITDGPTNKLSIQKSGAGIITLGAFTTSYPNAGNNSYTGGTTVNQGTLLVENPLALGGANGTIPGDVNLFGGTLDLRSNGGGIKDTIVLGNQSTNGLNVNVYGPSTINVDRLNSTTNIGNNWQINNLVLSENTLTISGANSYGFVVAGTTTIAGSYANINSISDQSNGQIVFNGLITGSGALNKYGTASYRIATITGSTNDYSGGTNLISGGLQITATTGTPLGTGRVNVFPGAALRVAGLDPSWQSGAFSSVAGQAQLKVHGYYNSLGIVELDNSFDPSSLLTTSNFSNAYGTMGLGLSTPFFTQSLDMSTIGDGKAFLISGLNTEVGYVAPTLAPGAGDGIAPRVYRLAGGVSNLAFIGADNQLNDLSATGTSLQVGLTRSTELNGAAANTGNTVIIRESNSFTGGTWIGKGSAIALGVGGSPAGSTPLGSADGTLTGAATDVIVYGTLSLENRLESSYVNAATGKNANNIILRPGGVVVVTDFAGSSAGGQGRWADTDINGGGLNLNGGTFQYNAAANLATSETVGTFTVDKNGRIIINRNADSSTSTLIVNDLVRANRGTLVIEPRQNNGVTANILGMPVQATVQLQQTTGYDSLIVSNVASAATLLGGSTALGAGATNTGMAPGWIVDVSTNSFVTYNPTVANTGYQALVTTGSAGAGAVNANGVFVPGPNQSGYSKVITATGAISGSIALGATDIVDVNAGGTVILNGPSTTVYALRTNRDINPTAANNTLTIASGALIATGNNLTFNNAPAPANGVPLGMTLNFGTGGAAEAMIYSNVNITINAQINAAGITHFAPVGSGANLILTGDNNLTGAVVINQGVIQAQNTLSGIGTAVTGVFNNQDVYLSGSTNRDASRLILDGRVGNATTSVLASTSQATSQFGGTIFVNGESRIDVASTNITQRINNLTFADLGASSPISLTINGVYVAGTTTLGANNNYIDAFFQNFAGTVLGGLVQGGTFEKYNNGTLLLAGTSNTYAGTIINESTPNTATSIVGSLTRTGSPFGSGPITINPGGMLRLADASNIANNVVSMKSNGVGLGGLAIAYNSTAPISALFGTGPGKVNISTTGDFAGTIALDINNYINPIDMSALEAAAGGKLWLGTSITATYFAKSLTPGSDNVYRLGGGGNQGNLTIGGGSFENVLTGTASVVIGAQTAGINPNGPAYVNGNIGSVTLTNRNNFSGGLTLNNQAGLTVNNAYAIGSGPLYQNGGNMTLNNTVSIANEIQVIGDIFSTSGGSNAAFTGQVKLAPADVGGTITLNMTGSGHLGFQGVISGASAAGTPGSNVIKTGAQTVIFNGVNTYLGTTTVINGFLGLGTDVSPNTPGALGNNDVPVILGNAGTNTAGSLLLGGQIVVDRGLIATGGNGTGINTLRGQSINRSTFLGGIAITGTQLNIDQVSTSNGTFRGGVLDLQGPISGTGLVQIGNTNVQGTVRLSASSNGYGISTFAGGLTLQAGRLQVNADTYYTGPANNPTIISGPLGLGTLTFGAGNANAGGEIVAYGADRVIVNPLGNLGTAADTTTTFGGHNNLTFTRDLNINSDGTLRNRTFNVLGSQGVTTFSGNLTSSGAAGGRLTKAGSGTLVLSGTNTFSGAAGTNLITISGGVLRFNSDVNLGAVSTTQKNISMAGGTTLVLVGTTPVTWDALGSNRNLLRTANGSFVDVRDVGGLLTINTQVTGAFDLSKQGSGMLALNNGTNLITTLFIGGSPAAAAANLPSGTFGGIVSTTATSGTPFGTTVTMYDGTLSLVGGAVAQALTVGTVNYGAGSSVQLNMGSTTTKLTATALTRLNQGTIVIVPSALANLGASEQLVTGSAITNANGMLTSPTIVVRDPTTADLNFVQNSGATGFTLHGSTTMGSFTTSDATQLADITGGAQAVGTPTFDVLALRTDSNVTGTGNQLRLTNGGLIFNGSTAPVISSNVFFGNGTTATEALVYVKGGQTGVSEISGSFTAANFTKSGLGDLLISGTNNIMAGTTTALKTLQINDGTVKFAGQSSLPSNGVIIISPMDGAAFDLNGQNLTIAALGGQTLATAATGRVINTGADATLTLAARTGITSNANGLITGNIALFKDGIGTVILGYNNDYTLGTTIGTGNITSASGVLSSLGALQVNSFSSLGTGPVNLAGGVLDIRNPIAANEVQDNIDVIAFGPGNGYDLVIKGLNNLGSANTTSTVNTTSTAGFQAVSTLTFESNAAGLYALTTGGGSDNGLLVRGNTTLAGNTLFNNNRNSVLAGKIVGTGFTVTKIGTNTLYLTNTERDAGANDVGRWNLFAGSLEARMSDGGSNPLTNGTTVQLNTTGGLNIRHDGDNLADPQVLTDFGSNTLQIGNLLPVSTSPTVATSFTPSPNTILNLGTNSGASNKTIVFNQLVAGGPLGTGFFSLNLAADNKYTVEFTNGLTMIKDAYLSLNNNGGSLANLTLSGQISGNGTLYKQGGGELDINTVATNTGGTVLAGGDTFFGSFEGQTRTLSTTAQLAPGNIAVQPGARLRFNALTNLNGDQLVEVRSNVNTLGLVGVAENVPIESWNIRAPFAAGAFSNSGIFAPLTGSGILALNTLYDSTIIDLSHLGDGTWFLGSTSDGSGLTVQSSLDGRYNSAKLLPGAAYAGIGNNNATYRLGGGAGSLYIGLAQPGSAGNQLFGNANLVVGADLTSGFGGTVGNGNTLQNGTGSAGVILNQDQSYTGKTLVNRGSQLEFRGAMATSSYDVFGILVAGGTTGSFVGGPAPVIWQGGQVNLDNQFDLLPVGNVQGRWGDTTPLNLNSGFVRVIGNTAADLKEVIGQVNVAGGSFLTPQRTFTGRIMEINVAGFTRLTDQNGITGNNGQLSIEPTSGGFLGTDERVTVAGANLAAQLANIPGGIVNGMVAPWMYNNRDVQFLTYSDFGFVNAGFTSVANGALTAASAAATDRTFISAASTMAAGVVLNTYALRADANITLGTAADTTAKIIIGSGGLITNGAISITPGLVFGSIATPGEAIIANNNNLVIGTTANPLTSGQITATSIVKSGDGNMFMDAEQGTFNGNIILNRGGLFLRAVQAVSNVGGIGGTIVINGFNSTVGFRGDTSGGNTFNNSLYIAPGNALVQINVDRAVGTTLTGQLMTMAGNLTFGGAPGDQGQTINFTNANTTSNYNFRVNGTTDLGPVGNAVFYNQNNSVTLVGPVIGSGTFVKEGANTLFLGNAGIVATTASTYSGGLILQQGTLQANSGQQLDANGTIVNSQFGSGDITLAGGALNIRVEGFNNATNRVYSFTNPNVNVVGNTTISVDRVDASGGSVKTIAFNNLNIGGQILTSNSGNTYSLRFNNVSLTGTPMLQVNNELILANVSDGGGQLYITKNGGSNLWMDGTNNTYSGGTFINQGTLRFGSPAGASTTAKAGPGTITVNPGAQVLFEALGNINVAAGQKIDVRSIPTSLGIVRLQSVFDPTPYITDKSTGLLLIPNSYSLPLNLGTIGDGTFQLAMQGDNTYTATSLGAGAGNVYRLGGNGQNFRITVTNNNVLTGANRLQIGSLASSGGTFVFNNSNDYTGGTTIVRGAFANFNSGGTGSTNTPFGSGQIDLFGGLLNNGGGGYQNFAGTATNNVIVLHPGSRLAIDAVSGAVDRWNDNTSIPLNGSTFLFQSSSGNAAQETVGSISFERGSRIQIINPGAPTSAHKLTINGTLDRVGRGTMVFTPGDTFGTNGANTDNIVVSGGAPATFNGMLPAYFVNSFTNKFVTVGSGATANFIQDAVDTVAIAPSATSWPSGLTSGTDIVFQVGGAAVQLDYDPVIYSFRGDYAIQSSVGRFSTLTLSGSGPGGGWIQTGGNTTGGGINIKFGPNGEYEGLFYMASGATLQVNGDVSANGITKFGAGVLNIAQDQSDLGRGPGLGYNNGWVVNEGQLTASVFGALGNAVASNTVVLNASESGVATLNLRANSGNPLNQIYTSGKISIVDNAAISFDPGADDRVNTISDVEVISTGGSLLDASLLITNNRNRTILQAGTLTITGTNAGALINVNASVNGNLTNGVSSGFSVASLIGTSDQRLDKRGNGVLYIREASTFSGAVNIEQGVIQISNVNGLGNGSGTNVITVNRFGTLDLNVAGFARTDVNFLPGSLLRLSADNAIAAPAINLGGGTLQVANDQKGTTTAITLNGGSIEGFLRTDDLLGTNQAVYRTLGAGVTFNLAGDSYLGQNLTQGANGLDNGRQANTSSPLGNTAAGVLLEIKGVISGVGGLTKQGNDTVTLSGANTYAGSTNIINGTLRIGADNSLPVTTRLTTSSDAVFNLNGFNQKIGVLSSPEVTSGVAGYITNTAFTTNTLTTDTAVDSTYSGVIQYNVALTKAGAGTLELKNANTYVGATTVNGGRLVVGHSTGTVIDGILNTSSLSVAGGAIFDVLPGTGNGLLTLSPTSGTVLTLAGGATIGVEVGSGTGNALGTGGTGIALDPGAKALVTGAVTVDVHGTGHGATTPSTVISAPGGGLLNTNGSSGSYVLGVVYNNTDFTVTGITQTDTLVQLNTTAATALTGAYWKGGLLGNANVWAASSGVLSNWATDLAGTATGLVPGATTDVFVSATSHVNENNMVLGADMTINSLTFNNTSGNPVTLKADGGYTLTIASASAITADSGDGSAFIASNVALAAPVATIAVNSTTNPLEIDGAISGGAVTKAGPGTLVLAGANSYTGPTLIAEGTLKAGAANTLPILSDLNFGSSSASAPAATAGTLDLSTNSVTVANLNVFTNSTTAVDQITIGGGQTLQVTGAFTVGPNFATSNTTTKLVVSGAGTLAVGTPDSPTSMNFKVGGSLIDGKGNSATLDMSGLTNFYANLGSGTFSVGDTADAGSGGVGNSTLIMATNNSITAAVFRMDADHGTGAQAVYLGKGTNVINADVISLGINTQRGAGTFGYDVGNTTGNLTVRAMDGVSRAVMNVAYGPAGTGVLIGPTVVDLTGHSANLLLSTLNVGGRTTTATASTANGTFRFDTGTLDVTGVIVGDRRITGAAANTSTGVIDLLGGSVTVGNGGILVATNTSTTAANVATGTVNVGGTAVVTVGATAGTSITLGNSTTAGEVANATLNITGTSSLTLAGNIIEAPGAGNASINSTVTLNGGKLDMAGNKIGTAAEPINNLNFQSGTLSSVSSINGTGGLTKTTNGLLLVEGTNTWTGATTISAGTLQVGTDATAATASTGSSSAVSATSATFVINGTAPTTTSGGTAVISGAPVLAGRGTVNGATTIGTDASNVGVLSPGQTGGTANGTLTINNTLTVNNGSQIQLGITSTGVSDSNFITSGQSALDYLTTGNPTAYSSLWSTATAGHDFLNVTGALTLGTGGAANSTVLVTSSGYTGALGDVFNLLDWAGVGTTPIGGTFTHAGGTNWSTGNGDLTLPDLGPTLAWDTSAFQTFGVVAVVALVPEPSRAMLLLLGLTSLTLRRRRRQG